jgi:GTP pyrophosphokinase
MRTLQYKSEFKQKENALETMEIYVPLAYYMGAYRIKSELEDLSLKYLKPDTYTEISDNLDTIKKKTDPIIEEMSYDISKLLTSAEIYHEIKIRTKNIYGIYKCLPDTENMTTIHDLLALKIMVDTVPNCYQTLMYVHDKYVPVNDKFKDYICNPKTNMYKSLHTTVFGRDNHLVQTQIRTFDMDKVASFGLLSYWRTFGEKASAKMQEDLTTKFQFFKSLTDLNNVTVNNQEFVSQVKEELFAKNIYVYTPKGEVIELPAGSTPIDFAYKVRDDIGHDMIEAIVNDVKVAFDYELKNKDRVRIVTSSMGAPTEDWLKSCKTINAKQKIKEYNHKKKN